LLGKSPGKKKEFWQRQLTALVVLERHYPKEIDSIAEQLSNHPFEAIRQRLATRRREDDQETITNAADGYELVKIPGGEFLMGSPECEEDRYDSEGPQDQVQVPTFFMGRYPVTNAQYQKYLEANHKASEPELWAGRDFNQPKQPVVGVSWEDARAYAHWAGLRLPTEAEWEYACRSGTTTRFCSGDKDMDLDKVGWYGGNSEDSLHAVGEKAPNASGLYDMHGNVWEWVEDGWHDDYEGLPRDGSAWIDDPRGTGRVVRGGSWYSDAGFCRSATRGFVEPGNRDFLLGFRLSRSVTLGP
jgi:formylglycine-generating enzyme required for sulfatase activity